MSFDNALKFIYIDLHCRARHLFNFKEKKSFVYIEISIQRENTLMFLLLVFAQLCIHNINQTTALGLR